MASVIERKLKSGRVYYISYRIPDRDGLPKQHWVRCDDENEAYILLPDVKASEALGQLFLKTPSLSFMASATQTQRNMTVSELMDEYVQSHGKKHWQPSTMSGNKGLIKNYIKPYIGDIPVSAMSPRLIQNYYDDLPNHKAVKGYRRKSEPENITVRMVKEIHKIMRPALDLAVRWGIIPINPILSVKPPKQPKSTRAQWTGRELSEALAQCNDELTYLCICLVFACSLRTGELAGLTWDCVNATEESIQNNSSYIFINKTLQRVNLEDINKEIDEDIIKRFPPVMNARLTVTVLKTTKTELSTRRIYLPHTVARLLIAHKSVQEHEKEFFGNAYNEYGLVISQPNGNPYDGRNLSKRFKDFTSRYQLRNVDFYSLRHTSATEKLRATHDVKAVQGDMGHARADMTQNVYSEIVDEDRKNNAILIEDIFFKHVKPLNP